MLTTWMVNKTPIILQFLFLASKDVGWEEKIQFDQGMRKRIHAYHPNLREPIKKTL